MGAAIDEETRLLICEDYCERGMTIQRICELRGVAPRTVDKYLINLRKHTLELSKLESEISNTIDSGVSPKEIKKVLGLSNDEMRRSMLNINAHKRFDPERTTKEKNEAIIKMYKETGNVSEVALANYVTKEYVCDLVNEPYNRFNTKLCSAEEIKELLDKGYTKSDVAKMYNCKLCAVTKRLKRAGIGVEDSDRISILTIKNQHANGMSAEDISKLYGIPLEVIQFRLDWWVRNRETA